MRRYNDHPFYLFITIYLYWVRQLYLNRILTWCPVEDKTYNTHTHVQISYIEYN